MYYQGRNIKSKFHFKYGGKIDPDRVTIDGESVLFIGNESGSMEVKFNRVAKIASRYDKIISDLNKVIQNNQEFPTNKDYNLATATLIILKTGIRIGNESSAEGFYSDYKEEGKTVLAHTYGLTTLLPEHVKIENNQVKFDFIGKKHVRNTFTLSPELSKIVIPIINSNYDPVFNITESDLTRFIKKITSHYFSSKDFRTFRANVYAYQKASRLPKPTTKKEWKEAVKEVHEYVAQLLNNTPSVAKTSYVDQRLFDIMWGTKESFDNKLKKKTGGRLYQNEGLTEFDEYYNYLPVSDTTPNSKYYKTERGLVSTDSTKPTNLLWEMFNPKTYSKLKFFKFFKSKPTTSILTNSTVKNLLKKSVSEEIPFSKIEVKANPNSVTPVKSEIFKNYTKPTSYNIDNSRLKNRPWEFAKGGVVKYKTTNTPKGKFTAERYLQDSNKYKINQESNKYENPKSKFGKELEDTYQANLIKANKGDFTGLNVDDKGVVTFKFKNKDYRLGTFVETPGLPEVKVPKKEIKEESKTSQKPKTSEKEDKTPKAEVKTEEQSKVKVDNTQKKETTSDTNYDFVYTTLDWEDKHGYRNWGLTSASDYANKDAAKEAAIKLVKSKVGSAYDDLPTPLAMMAFDWTFNSGKDARPAILQAAGFIDAGSRASLEGERLDKIWNSNKQDVLKQYNEDAKKFLSKYYSIKNDQYTSIFNNTNRFKSNPNAASPLFKGKTQLEEWLSRNSDIFKHSLHLIKKNGGKFTFKKGGRVYTTRKPEVINVYGASGENIQYCRDVEKGKIKPKLSELASKNICKNRPVK